MFGDILYRLGQLLLALIIIGFVLYKLALTLDLVPEGFSPSGFAAAEYKGFKDHLLMESFYPNPIGKMSKILLRIIDKIETKVADDSKPVDQECQASSIYRFFMGDDDPAYKRCNAATTTTNNKKQVDQKTQPGQQAAPAVQSPAEQTKSEAQQLQELNQQLKQIQEQYKPQAQPAPAEQPAEQPADILPATQ